MHYTWNIVAINKEAGVVRAFHCEKDEGMILRKARASLDYCRKEMSLELGLSELCAKKSLFIKECIHFYDDTGICQPLSSGDKEQHQNVIAEIKEIDWRAFISSGARPDRERGKFESALYLLGLNPVARHLPFSSDWLPPHDLQLISVAKAICSIRGGHWHGIAAWANKEQSAFRMAKYYDFMRKLYPRTCLTEDQNALLDAAFRL